MGSLGETLPSVKGLPLPCLSFLFPPLEQVPWEPAAETSPTSLARLGAMAIIALVPLADLTLEPVPHWSPSFLSTSLLLSYFPSNFCLEQLPS